MPSLDGDPFRLAGVLDSITASTLTPLPIAEVGDAGQIVPGAPIVVPPGEVWIIEQLFYGNWDGNGVASNPSLRVRFAGHIRAHQIWAPTTVTDQTVTSTALAASLTMAEGDAFWALSDLTTNQQFAISGRRVRPVHFRG